jgi:hypothetical protein
MLAAGPILHEAIKRGRAARGIPVEGGRSATRPDWSQCCAGWLTTRRVSSRRLRTSPPRSRGRAWRHRRTSRAGSKIIKVASRGADGKPNGSAGAVEDGAKSADVFTVFVDPRRGGRESRPHSIKPLRCGNNTFARGRAASRLKARHSSKRGPANQHRRPSSSSKPIRYG